MRLALFDLDHTLIPIDSDHAWGQFTVTLGWRDAGKTGTKDECLAWIKETWTDMRPLSLRKAMADSQ